MSPPLGPDEGKSRLKQVLTDKIETAALRYEAAELEGMAKQAEAAAKEFDSRKERPVSESEEAQPRDTKQRLVDHVTTLLQAGSITPKQAGEILSSGMSYPQMSLGGGASMEDVLALMKFVLENKPNGDLDKISAKLEKLEEKLSAKSSKDGETVAFKPPSPTAQLKESLEFLSSFQDAANRMGFVIPSTAGETTEQLKEKNRHTERLEEIKAEREHKEGLRDLMESVPEKIGRGLARHIREGGEEAEEGENEGGGMESFPCSSCKHKVYVPPNAGNVLHCGFCGMKYQKGGAQQAETPSSTPKPGA